MAGPIEGVPSSPRYTLALGGIMRQPNDSLANPYGNDSVEISSGTSQVKETVPSTPEFGGFGEFHLTLPSGLGAGYRLGVLATPGSNNIHSGQGKAVINSRDAVIENSLLFSWTPIGETSGSPFSFRLGAGPTLSSVFSTTTRFTLGDKPAISDESNVQHRFGVGTSVDMNLQLLNSVGLVLGGSASFFGSAGTMLGANAGLTLDL
ncbi:hypothetical protein A3K48_07590 [candidate division WOR-1 bacterium RIFOXYA12_FULL_52_29]|uniref:Uncharacterized protein n=1 Tax=candidate division WOR-1 bacterium RIFOXYC12_FULL_54_18 TaxID=1802584 RepID=A0A1F4T8C2_UNCSA|nr:MAG: hypothetical protein A3K44_07590 [candidate division WOR-1 bacterium RIFOXYA2_FULL_51_19]OGC18373.1 MAG: hypothetical protein A3K48_07590 [candidate division WOR-1 bacterium RIFOXYA12_FULL_52_29]OGC27228.1 MAG: hypothetical protein A3K32_07585 [candidate division WOR-1 bacterium RIFOXYB2_FULL_45_9]OGC28790.1 MAG: hypothetical protein A3K49_07590 [candidate division WOR-1 bacterium RIFOXYC12_FULL_54_18]OGC30756.1 MAG: hypothetical protein A2346_05025 [candidate division WOR-1 bacterium R